MIVLPSFFRQNAGFLACAGVVMAGVVLELATAKTEVVMCRYHGKDIEIAKDRKIKVSFCELDNKRLVEARFKKGDPKPETGTWVEMHIKSSVLGTRYELHMPSI
jgi:hypothetical protein